MLHQRPTDQDIERVLSGKTPEDEDLAGLLPMVDSLRRAVTCVPPEAETSWVAAQAAQLAKAASLDTPAAVHRTAAAKQRRTSRMAPRLAGALVVVLLLCSTTGVAFAADGSIPGDTLYAFDRAVERIGIGAGGLQERLHEANTLAAKGRIDEGLAHATGALAEGGGQDVYAQEAHAALLAAANAVANAATGEADRLRTGVAEILQWMALTQTTGNDFLQGVATRVRALSCESGGQASDPRPVDQTATTADTQPQDTTPGTTTTDQQGATPTTQQGSTTGTTTGQPETTVSTAASQSTSGAQTQGGSTSPTDAGPSSTSAQGAGRP